MKARQNPFSSDRLLKVRYQVQDPGWPALFERLRELDCRAAIVGPKGTGKTTLLEDLGTRLQGQGSRITLLRLRKEHSAWPVQRLFESDQRPNRQEVVLVDGAEQLGWLSWQQLKLYTRHAGGLIITQHDEARLPTLIRCATSPELLERILEDVLGATATSVSPVAKALYNQHGGNLREVLRGLYDHYAENRGGGQQLTHTSRAEQPSSGPCGFGFKH